MRSHNIKGEKKGDNRNPHKVKITIINETWYVLDKYGRVLCQGTHDEVEEYLDHLDNNHHAA